jgi:hypothetical protein
MGNYEILSCFSLARLRTLWHKAFLCDTINFMTGYNSFMLLLMLTLTVFSCAKTSPDRPINTTPEGIAIKGYDPVSYFTEKRALKGKAEYEFLWKGAKWRFISAEHREMFRGGFEKYAPQYGGYCAYAVSQGKVADIDPEAWTVFEGRLYLNLNKKVQRLWEKDMKEYIRKADEQWPRMLRKRHGI